MNIALEHRNPRFGRLARTTLLGELIFSGREPPHQGLDGVRGEELRLVIRVEEVHA